MELDPTLKKLKITTQEPFGKLLLDLMYNSSIDNNVLSVQRHIGGVLVEAYINSQFSNIRELTVDNYSTVLDIDVARDIANKSENFARENNVTISFDEEHFEGIKQISLKEVNDLPELYAEREVIAVAVQIGYIPESARYVDERELEMIDEEIEQAKAAQDVLKAITCLEGRN